MPNFKKDRSKFIMKGSPYAKEVRWEGPRGGSDNKAKQVVKKQLTPTPQKDWEPAWEGADIGKREWENMTKKEQEEYTAKFGD